MTITARLDLVRPFDVLAPTATVFGVLADVPLSVSHFPQVERLTEVGAGSGVYEWQMERVGTEKVRIQTRYASRYESTFDPAAGRGTVTWVPVAGVGNARVGGRWDIEPRGTGTHHTLTIRGEIDVPLPALMTRVVAPLVSREFERLVGRYIENLRRRFDASQGG